VLRLGVIDGDDGVAENAVLGHALQADDASRRLFRAGEDPGQEVLPLGMSDGDEVRPVVHGDRRAVAQSLEDVPVIGVVVLALDGEDGDLVVLDQGGGNVVLGAEGVRSAEPDVGPSELEGLHQVGRLRGHVEAGRDADSREGLLLGESLLDPAENGHGAGRPFHP
jgi:hypothetical protein